VAAPAAVGCCCCCGSCCSCSAWRQCGRVECRAAPLMPLSCDAACTLYVRPHTPIRAIYVSAYTLSMCPHTPICVSAYL
jgi:hypothetical protein